MLEPYREAFSDKHEGCMTGGDIPPHRYLFHAYTYQYHLLEFSVLLISIVRSTSKLVRAFAEAFTARRRHEARERALKNSALASLGIRFQLLPPEHMGSRHQSRA